MRSDLCIFYCLSNRKSSYKSPSNETKKSSFQQKINFSLQRLYSLGNVRVVEKDSRQLSLSSHSLCKIYAQDSQKSTPKYSKTNISNTI